MTTKSNNNLDSKSGEQSLDKKQVLKIRDSKNKKLMVFFNLREIIYKDNSKTIKIRGFVYSWSANAGLDVIKFYS